MGAASDLPDDVLDWLRWIFAACNARITEKLSMNPNCPEESLDLSWIEHLTHFSSPLTLESNWTVKIETHYLGGMRHFYRWEIADIGILVFMRFADARRKSKVALLQSKRLYPRGETIREETIADYQIGLGRLADPEDQALPISFDKEFRFTKASRYQALKQGSQQAIAIAEYQEDVGLAVYYQLYNPWVVPFIQRVPLAGYVAPEGAPELGIRLVPYSVIHGSLTKKGQTPRLSDLDEIGVLPRHGWRLEDFICDELLSCREGDEFGSINDPNMQRLFNRRSGPISAAIAISIEAPASTRAHL